MTAFSPLDSALYESTPEKIAASLRYLRKADAVMAALMPLGAHTTRRPGNTTAAKPQQGEPMPNPSSIKALSLRTQALALLEQAAEIDGLAPYLVTHSHDHGETTYIAWGLKEPNEEEAVSILEEEFEPEYDGLIVNEAAPIKELCGLVPAYRIPDAMAGKEAGRDK